MLSTKIVRDAENWISSCGKQFFALHSEIKIIKKKIHCSLLQLSWKIT